MTEDRQAWARAVREFSCPFCGREKGRPCKAVKDDIYTEPRDLVKPHENRLRLTEAEIKQIVYRYPVSERGSGQFAVWHLGASVVTVYGPEGNTLKTLRLDAATRADADSAARSHREVISVTESSSLYPVNP